MVLATGGIPLVEAIAVLGHANPTMLLSVYAKFASHLLHGAADAIDRALGGA